MDLLRFRTRKPPRHGGRTPQPQEYPCGHFTGTGAETRWHPAPVPELDHSDGLDVIEAIEEQRRRGASMPGRPSYPFPLRFEAPPPGLLGKLEDGLRNLDGPGGPSLEYREVRAAVETVPFRAVEDDEAPAPAPAYARPRDLAADLADLPSFREALRRHTRHHAGQCLCGDPLAGDTWGGRMVSAGTHLLGGAA